MKVTVNNLEKEEVIDWGKVQLVISKDDDESYIILATKETDQYKFSGVRLFDNSKSRSWAKCLFKPFHGSITLQND